MKAIDSRELSEWMKGDEGETPDGENFYFVIVKTPSCPKCDSLIKNEKILEKENWFRTFVFNNKDDLGLQIMQNIGITSAPFIIFRYKIHRKNFFKYLCGTIQPDMNDFIDTENTLDAIYQNDSKYFNVNEYGEVIEGEISEEDCAFVSLLYEIYGEPDTEGRETLKEDVGMTGNEFRKALKEE